MTTIAGTRQGEIKTLRTDAENLIESARGFRTLAHAQTDLHLHQRLLSLADEIDAVAGRMRAMALVKEGR